MTGVRTGRALSVMNTLPTKKWRLLCEFMTSVYCAVLLVAADRMGSQSSWVLRMRRVYLSFRFGTTSMGIDDNAGMRLTSFLLVWLVAVLIFSVFWLLHKLRFARIATSLLAGGVALLGLPLANLYSGQKVMFFLLFELMVCCTLVVLYSFGKWMLSPFPSFILLFLHYVLWTFVIWQSFSLDFLVAWPEWDHYIYHGKNVQLVYAFFGFACAMAWAWMTRSRLGRSRSESE